MTRTCPWLSGVAAAGYAGGYEVLEVHRAYGPLAVARGQVK